MERIARDGGHELRKKLLGVPMATDERLASLLRRAQRPLHGREDDAPLVSAIGDALVRNQLGCGTLRSVRLAVADHEPRDEVHAASLRTVRDMLRAAEAARHDIEARRDADAALAHPLKGAIVRELAKWPSGPSELARGLGVDEAAVSRALKDLEAVDLVCPAEKLADGRGRPRELAAHGHQSVHRQASAPAVPVDPEVLQQIVDVAVGLIADVQAQQAVDRPVIEALALRHAVALPLAREVSAAVARSAERLGLLDDDDDDDGLRWGAVHGVHAQLVEIVEAHPERWDAGIHDPVGAGDYIVVARDVDAWRAALRRVGRGPEDVVLPSKNLLAVRVFDDATIARDLACADVPAWLARVAANDTVRLARAR